MKIAICDDDALFLNATCMLIEEFCRLNPNHSIKYEKFDKPIELVNQLKKGKSYDVLILDILMPEYNGIELAKEFRIINSDAKIIFVTITPEYAVNSYEVDAFYYLLKPIDSKILFKLLSEIQAGEKKEKNTTFTISNFGNITSIQISSILYVEVLKHKIHFHTVDNRVHTTYGKLKDVSSKLEIYDNFLQCHKSFIVNIEQVSMIIDHNFKMKNNTLVPISRQYYKATKQVFMKFVTQYV